MYETHSPITTTLRIPGHWSHPRELVERLPTGFRLTPDALILPDGEQIEMMPMPPDNQFAHVFESSCRRPATSREMKIVNEYRVNIALIGPGGSMRAAGTMMQAAAAIVRAGAAGVFIDNSALAHGGSDWIEMTEDGSPDTLSFAFAGIVRGPHEVWSVGMHVMGLPDVVMRRSELDVEGETIVEVIRYLCQGVAPIQDGHWLADLDGLRFQAQLTSCDQFDNGSPMYNPFGRLKLVSVKRAVESN